MGTMTRIWDGKALKHQGAAICDDPNQTLSVEPKSKFAT